MLDPEVPEERREQIATEARQRIESAGTLKQDTAWGMRKLAYEILQRTEADYRLFRFETGGELLGELDHNLRIAEGVLRFRIFKVDPRSPAIVPPPPLSSGAAAPPRGGRRRDAAPSAEARDDEAPAPAEPAEGEKPTPAPAEEATAAAPEPGGGEPPEQQASPGETSAPAEEQPPADQPAAPADEPAPEVEPSE